MWLSAAATRLFAAAGVYPQVRGRSAEALLPVGSVPPADEHELCPGLPSSSPLPSPGGPDLKLGELLARHDGGGVCGVSVYDQLKIAPGLFLVPKALDYQPQFIQGIGPFA